MIVLDTLPELISQCQHIWEAISGRPGEIDR